MSPIFCLVKRLQTVKTYYSKPRKKKKTNCPLLFVVGCYLSIFLGVALYNPNSMFLGFNSSKPLVFPPFFSNWFTPVTSPHLHRTKIIKSRIFFWEPLFKLFFQHHHPSPSHPIHNPSIPAPIPSLNGSVYGKLYRKLTHL